MKTMSRLVLLTLLVPAPAHAQGRPDGAALCAMSERHYAAIRANDRDAVIRQHTPEFTIFPGDGGLLWNLGSPEQQGTEFQERTPSFSSTTRIHHCSAQVHGNSGIATFYLVGSVTVGTITRTGTWRVTEVWIRQGNEWREAHHHESPLLESVRP